MKDLEGALKDSGQDHLLQYIEELSDVEKATLLAQVSMINLKASNDLYNSQMDVEENLETEGEMTPIQGIEQSSVFVGGAVNE